jgi:hypothetical protein
MINEIVAEKYNNINTPVITKTLEISTIHITEEDNKILIKLKDDPNTIIFTSDEYGYKIFIPISSNDRMENLKLIKKAGLSQSFNEIFQEGIKLNVNLISIDRDGPVYDNLPKFNW